MTKSEIIRYLHGETTSAERARMLEWLESDPAHMEEYRCLRRIFDATLCSDNGIAVDAGTDADAGRRPARGAQLRRLVRVAAAVAVACLLGGMGWFYAGHRQETAPLLATRSIYVPVGQRTEVTLSDGTHVWLNSNTTLRLPAATAGRRDIELSGEAYFEVTHDEHKPFVVHTGNHEVKVLGTKFNVYAYDDSRDFSVRLYDGAVDVSDTHTKESLLLAPNEKARMLAGGQLAKSSFDKNESLLWIDGIYFFDDLDYGTIFKKLEEYYKMHIDVRSPKVLAYRCTCKFRQEDGLHHILDVMQSLHPFSYEWDDNNQTVTVR